MLFVSMEDFFVQTKDIPRLSRAEEIALAQRMAAGDRAARETLIHSHLPMVAAYVKRAPQQIRTLHTVYACLAMVESCVDRFDFLQDSEPFVHYLGWGLRQCITRCIADRP